jgi:ABC-type multidrug transport system fused ATPase/permease subunit
LGNIALVQKLWSILSRYRKKQFLLILLLVIIASLAEIISLGAVIPFLGVITSLELVFEHPFAQPFINFLSITEPSQIIAPITIFFMIAILFAGSIRVLLIYVLTRFSYATGADLSNNIYKRTLYQEYLVHVSQNTSEVINGIITKTNIVISGVITPVLNLISSIVILIGIMAVLLLINFSLSIILLTSFSLIYMGITKFTKQQLSNNSSRIATQSTMMVKSLQEGLGGIRDVLIDGSQEFYCSLYRNADSSYRRATAMNVFIALSPRYIIESIGMVAIVIFSYAIVQQQNNIIGAVPILGALALGMQRLLPVLQIMYASYTNIQGSKSSFLDVLSFLERPLPKYLDNSKLNPILFKNKITLNDVCFRYSQNTPWVLKNINLTITKGSSVGFIGATGSGKSTLIDIIMSLLIPETGELNIDGQVISINNRRAWQTHIAHVPQDIFLSDGSISENIAFGVTKDKIDFKRVEEVAKKAQISELIEGWADGYKTLVGERGSRVSGGQRQRIGIARALYKKAEVLIFDEATSSLDSKTEESVMRALDGLGSEITVLIIAHRLTTLKDCDQIIKLDRENVIQSLKYEDIINQN